MNFDFADGINDLFKMSISDHLKKPVKALQGLELHYVGDIAIIVMDCGENRLNTPFVDAFNELMDDIERNPSCKGLITTGKGKFYGNGLDVEWMSSQSPEALEEYSNKLRTWVLRLALFPLPTLAALNGHAFAGGALVAICHDLRVQSKDKGWFCFNEVFISRRFGQFNYNLMRTKIGSRHYSDAVVLGKRYNAAEALDSGIIHGMASSSLLISESIQLLKSFYGKSGYPRESMYLIKCDVYRDVIEQFERDMGVPYVKSKL